MCASTSRESSSATEPPGAPGAHPVQEEDRMSRARAHPVPERIDPDQERSPREHDERLAAEADLHLDRLEARASLRDVSLEE